MARRLGDLIYFLDSRHRSIAQSNILRSVAGQEGYKKAALITRRAYQAFAQNLVEISFIPRIDVKYLDKYIQIENRQFIEQAFKTGKGVIYLGMHEGNWELSNIISANLGVPFSIFVRDQGFKRLNALLNSYRVKKGCRIIHKDTGLRKMINALKNSESIGMTVDQGGKNGEIVDFFGHQASMATGALRMALKHDCLIIPAFYARVKGPYMKVFFDQIYTAKRMADPVEELRTNLQALTKIFEKYIRQYPQEYLWTYKIWKYGRERNVLILSDAKAGHLRQSEGLAKILALNLQKRGFKSATYIRQVRFKSKWHRILFTLGALFIGKYPTLDFSAAMMKHLTTDTQNSLLGVYPDIVISCGSLLYGVNHLLSRTHQAKSIVLMRPSFLGTKRFDLVVEPLHDNPPAEKNVLGILGALNTIDQKAVAQAAQRLINSGVFAQMPAKFCLGVLIGGNSKNFTLDKETMREAARQIKAAADELDANIFITTSRRTTADIERMLQDEFCGEPRCKLLIIANEKNIPDAVAGILGLSRIVVTTPESISMISEAASSGRHVLVLDLPGLSRKHRFFLENYNKHKYVYVSRPGELKKKIAWLWRDSPAVNTPSDNLNVQKALDRIL
jgi:lauroyl/myristoyl acyltransferase/mitochondrial fission protein ELM1